VFRLLDPVLLRLLEGPESVPDAEVKP